MGGRVTLHSLTAKGSEMPVRCDVLLCERYLEKLKGAPILFSGDVIGRANKAKQRAKYKKTRLNIIGRESMVKAESEHKMGLEKSVVL